MDFYTYVGVKGNNIYCTAFTDGKREYKIEKYKPSLFILSKKEEKYKSLIGSKNLGKVEFDSISEMREFKQSYKGIPNYEIHGSVRPEYMYLAEEIPGIIKPDFNKMNIVYFDIECDSSGNGFPEPEEAKWPITAITMVYPKESLIRVYTYETPNKQFFDVSKLPDDFASFNIIHREAVNEKELLDDFLFDWENNYPDIISGYNSIFFDMTYVVNRINNILKTGSSKRLSPFRIIKECSDKVNNKEQMYFDIYGVSQIDFAQIFKKFAYSYGSQESYSLDNIANVVIGERKLDYSEYGSLENLYSENYQLYCEYNIRDADIVYRMNLKTRLIELAMTIAFKAGCLFEDTLGTNAVWEALLYRDLLSKNIASPPRKQGEKPEEFFGGFVQDVIPGRYEDVVSFDFNSLYPNIEIQQNISPETLVYDESHDFSYLGEKRNFSDLNSVKKYENYSICCNGSYFDKTKVGVIPSILSGLYAERKEVQAELKKEILSEFPDNNKIIRMSNMELAIKTICNAGYGALGNPHFPYYEMQVALAITQTGQYLLTRVSKEVNDYLNNLFKTDNIPYCVYMDTDSIYITLKELTSRLGNLSRNQKREVVKDFSDNNLTKVINNALQKIAIDLNSYTSVLKMSREVIAESAIWLAKKRYIMDVIDLKDKYYEEGKLKVMGVEAVRSSTPKICRDKFKDVFFMILRNEKENTQKFISDFKGYFFQQRPEEISFPRGINNISKFQEEGNWMKGTPIHVKGAIVYNNLLEEKKLTKKYKKLLDGDKGKFCYLKQPNFLGKDVISFKDYLYDELGLRDYVDYEMQFEKTFLSPIQGLLEVIGWKVEEENEIYDMFI